MVQQAASTARKKKGFAIAIGALLVFIVVAVFIWQLLTGFNAATAFFEPLSVTAPITVLHAGESTQLTVRKKHGFFFRRPLEHPEATTYFTVSESELVVEPDGRVTCVGTHGQREDEIWIYANNGNDDGHTSFTLLPSGAEPALEFVTPDIPKSTPLPDYFTRYSPCCSGDPLVMTEGQTVNFKLARRTASSDNVTSKATYTIFFGSGVPNDARPSVVTGGPDYITSRTFHLDASRGIITAPPSIGRYNRYRVVIFARLGDLVGWKYVIITHAEPDGREGHLRLHPNDNCSDPSVPSQCGVECAPKLHYNCIAVHSRVPT